jgi:all-trans-8'-apo-beta-carotenal 15,15'-oxygenase
MIAADTITVSGDASVSIPTFDDLGYGHDVFEPVRRECDEVLADVSGTLPAALTGTLYRNGPARWAREHAVHAFDGDGMVSQLVLDGGSVRYRNRFVRTPNYLAGSREPAKELRGIGTQRPGGVRANALRAPTDHANTHAVVYAERLLALADGGRPWQLDLDTLDTLGPCDFDGGLPRRSMFSPHPKIDPHTGDLFNFGLAPTFRRGRKPTLRAGLRCYRVGRDRRLVTLATVPLDHPYINHDFAITEHYLVFVLAPLVINKRRVLPALLGLTTYEHAAEFRTDLGTKIVLVPRHAGTTRIVECPAIAYVHLNNAFEDHGDLVADLVPYQNFETFIDPVRDVNTMTYIPAGRLARMRVTAKDRIVVEDLCAELGEFPQHDWRRTARRYRYSYYSGYSSGSTHSTAAVIKVDNDRGTHRAHLFATGSGPGEPIFVPRHHNAAEDDGWLLILVALAEEQRTALYILDAHNIEADPIAIARLPHYAFPGFHGTFTPRVARS